MLYETLAQPYIIFALIGCGIIGGLLFDVANSIAYLCNKNKVVYQILEFLAMSTSLLGLFFVNLCVNYGRFRFFVLLIFFATLILWRLTIGKLWTKLIEKWYNKTREHRLKQNEGQK